jgi:phospholipase C
MAGPDWDTTAIFISYDEWGGFYDHVPPPVVDGDGFGLRVPGIVISPYARAGYVDHQVYSSASWLKIVEDRFGLPSLTARDASADAMLGAFDFSQPSRPPVILAATMAGSPYRSPYQGPASSLK